MNTTNDWVLREGMDVLASDGEKIGEVKDAMGESFSVKEGWFFPKEYIIPSSAITSVDDNAVYLGLTKDQTLGEDWTAAAGGTVAAGTYGDVYTDAAVAGENIAPADRATSDTDTYVRDAAVADADTIRVPLSEEELVASKREVDRGTVRVERDVVTEEQSLDVPVTEEEVRVSRLVVDRDVEPGEDAFQEGTIEIPVHGEEVDVEKRARVTGELDIEKQATTRTEHVSDTVRREEAHVVDENGNVIDGGTLSTDDRPVRQ